MADRMTADQMKTLQSKIKTEALRRSYNGSIASYGTADWDFTEVPVSGTGYKSSQGEKIIKPLLAIKDYGDLVTDIAVNRPVPNSFSVDLLAFVDALAAVPLDAQTPASDVACRSACTGLCTTSCISGCKGSCYTGCTGTCGSGCASTCYTACTGCGNTCSSGCKDNCTGCSSTCSGACSGCTGGCTGGCQGNCTGQCSSCSTACGTSCSGLCKGSNTGYVNCSDCATGCYTLCSGVCGTSSCSGSCTSICTGCGSGCSSGCSTACIGGCGFGCSSGCSGGCYNNCSGCGSTCVSGCFGCTGSCSATCTGTCYTSCTGTCYGSCTSCGSTCGTTCGSGCSSGCKSGCSDTCFTTCNTTCSTVCTGACYGTCSASCTISCSATATGVILLPIIDLAPSVATDIMYQQFAIPNITEAKSLGKASDATFDDTVSMPYTTKFVDDTGVLNATYSSVPAKAFDTDVSHSLGFLAKTDLIMLQYDTGTSAWICLAAYNTNNPAYDTMPTPFQLVVLSENLDAAGLTALQSDIKCSNYDIKNLIGHNEVYYTSGGIEYFFNEVDSQLKALSLSEAFKIPTITQINAFLKSAGKTLRYPLDYVVTALNELDLSQIVVFFTSSETYYDTSGSSVQGLILPADTDYVCVTSSDGGATWSMINFNATTSTASMVNFGGAVSPTRLESDRALIVNASYNIRDLLTYDQAYYDAGGTDYFHAATYIRAAGPIHDDALYTEFAVPTLTQAKQIAKAHDATYDDTLDMPYVATSLVAVTNSVIYSSQPIIAYSVASNYALGVLTAGSVIILQYSSGSWNIVNHYNSDSAEFAAKTVTFLSMSATTSNYNAMKGTYMKNSNHHIRDYIVKSEAYYTGGGKTNFFNATH